MIINVIIYVEIIHSQCNKKRNERRFYNPIKSTKIMSKVTKPK